MSNTPTTAKRRRIKPARLIMIIILFVIVAYIAVCVVKFIAETAIPMIFSKDGEISAFEPVFEEYTGNRELKSAADIGSDERITVTEEMMLINRSNLLPEGFEPNVGEYSDSGVWMNVCIQDGYKALSEEVRDRFSEKLFVSSAYRTAEEQQRQIEEEGDTAQEIGASEHQAGLALDVYIMYYAGMGFLKTDTGKWVNSDCWRYGFIIRYPNGKTRETGIEFEPWHIRYVGSPHAEYIMKKGLCLEEYFGLLEVGSAYRITASDGEYIVTRSTGDFVSVPEGFIEGRVSPDNTGGWIGTFLVKETGEE